MPSFKTTPMRAAAALALAGGLGVSAQNQVPIPNQVVVPSPAPMAVPAVPDYSKAVPVFPRVWAPYRNRTVAPGALANAPDDVLEVHDGKVRLSMAQVVALVVHNNLTVAGTRYYLPEAKTDLLRAYSGASPRGVDQATVPSGVFAGAEGGAFRNGGRRGGGASNAGGITGAASSVRVSPSGTFDPTFGVSFSVDRTSSPLNTLVVAGIPHVTTNTEAATFSYTQAFPSGTSISASYGVQRQGSSQLHLLYNPAYTPGFTATVSQQLLNGFGFKVNRALNGTGISIMGHSTDDKAYTYREFNSWGNSTIPRALWMATPGLGPTTEDGRHDHEGSVHHESDFADVIQLHVRDVARRNEMVDGDGR